VSRDRLVNAVVLTLLAVAVGLVLTSPTGPLAAWLSPLEYGETTVTIQNGTDNTTLATVDVRVADTERERHVGLGETERLEDGQGMLFVHPESGSYAYVMRNMSFPIDIVFVDADGTITAIHHAPVASDPQDPDRLYRGTGRYVLEVPYGWTNETGVTVGDRVAIPDAVRD